jgi:hypothetical protein
MEVSFELLIVLMPTTLFTLATILVEDYKIIFSILSALCWIVLGLGFVGTNPTYPAYGLLFLAIAFIFILLTFREALSMWGERKKRRWSTELD